MIQLQLMIDREQLALPEPKSGYIEVDSDNLWLFLMGPRAFPYQKWSFSKRLELPYMTPLIEGIYKDTKAVSIDHTESAKYLSAIDLSVSGKKNFSDAEGFLKQTVGTHGDAERAMIIYYDPERPGVDVTDLVHGSHEGTDSDVPDLIDKGKIPLMEMHTHPSDSLFSYPDLMRAIYNYGDGAGSVRSILVLTPKFQILGLPTPNTPAFSDEELNKWYYQQREFDRQIEASFDSAIKQLSRKLARLKSGFKSTLLREALLIRTMVEAGEINQVEAKRLSEMQTGPDSPHFRDYYVNSMKLSGDFTGAQYRFDNSRKLEDLRDLNFQLFISSDKSNFDAFSA